MFYDGFLRNLKEKFKTFTRAEVPQFSFVSSLARMCYRDKSDFKIAGSVTLSIAKNKVFRVVTVLKHTLSARMSPLVPLIWATFPISQL